MARGELKKASDLFEKYKARLVAPEGSVVNAFIEVVEDLFGIKLSSSQVKYRPGTKTLSLIGVAPLRQEIKRREREVLDHLKGRLGEKGAPKTIL